jgi:nucleoid-associated protein YgaU
MPVYSSTRYENREVVLLKFHDGTTKITVDKAKRLQEEDLPSGFFFYSVKPNETVWSISTKFTGSPEFFSVICDLNYILDPFENIENLVLKIPYDLKSVELRG